MTIQDPLVTPYPEDYWLIMTEARRLARREIEAQLRGEGVRVSLVPRRVISEKANELLARRLDIYRQAVKTVAAHPEWRPKRRRKS